MNKLNNEYAVAAFNQYWQNARHIANERFKYMATYFALFGAFMYIVYGSKLLIEHGSYQGIKPFLIICMILLTIISTIITAKLEHLNRCYVHSAKNVLFLTNNSKYDFFIAVGLMRKISCSSLYIIIYLFFLCFLVALLWYEVCAQFIVWIITFLGIIWLLISCLLFFVIFPQLDARIIKEFETNRLVTVGDSAPDY